MLLVTELLRWWYTAGFRQRVQKVALGLDGTIDYFSMDLLLKTLFAPFRQIDAGRVNGSLEVKLQALGNKLFSRLIGALIRLVVLFIGVITILLQALLALVVMIVWLVLPLAPFFGIGLAFLRTGI